MALATDNVPVSLFYCAWHAITRTCRDTDKKISPDQALSREETLRCMTLAGAELSFEEDIKGSLEPGKLADMAILSDDPLTCDEDNIAGIVAETTIVDGQVVYQRSSHIQ